MHYRKYIWITEQEERPEEMRIVTDRKGDEEDSMKWILVTEQKQKISGSVHFQTYFVY